MFAKTPVAEAVNVATSKATNVAKSAKRPGPAAPTSDKLVGYCVNAYADALSAQRTYDDSKEALRAAREGLRIELARAHKVIGAGKPWDAFKGALRTALVAAGLFADVKAAGRLIDNSLIALGLTGQGTRKGGKRKGAGRKERTETGEAKHGDAARACVAALAYIADAQAKHAGDEEMIEVLGDLARILGGAK